MDDKTDDLEAWERLGEKVVFSKYSRKMVSVDFKLPDGSVTDYIIDDRTPSVAVLGLTSDNQVILARQFRPGPMAVINDMPGGLIDDGEDALTTARREFLEETGYEGDFELAGQCLV